MAKSNFSEIWPIGGGNYCLYSEDREKLKRVVRWKSVALFNTHLYPDDNFRAEQIVFSSNQYNRIADVFGLPRKDKSQGRVEQGEKMARINRVLRKKEFNKLCIERLS